MVDAAGETRWHAQSDAYTRPTAEQLASAIRKAIAGRFDDAAHGAVGICVPGTRASNSHTVLVSVNLPALEGLNLDDLVCDATGATPAHVEVITDATAAAFDIFSLHRLKGRLCSIALGTGIGLGVLDDGIPLMVDGESSGHIGQMDVSIEGEPVIGPDGGAGSLEGYLGAPALASRYGPDMAKTLARLTADDAPVKALARAIRVCHAIYCPEHVALVGGIGVRLQHLLPTIRQMVEKDLTRIARPGWTLLCGSDDFHAARGAAKYAAAHT
jgi:predicted NBD/HSP70 family sugar kinase